MDRGRFSAPKPVAAGDLVDVTIEGQGGAGDGIAKVESFVIFVKGAKKGDRCRVRIVDVKRTYAVGEKVGNAADSSNSETVQEMDDETEGFRDGPAG